MLQAQNLYYQIETVIIDHNYNLSMVFVTSDSLWRGHK